MVFSLVACVAAVASCGTFLIASGTFTCSRGSYFQRLSASLETLEDNMELLQSVRNKIEETQHTPQQERRNSHWFKKVGKLQTKAEKIKEEASAEIEAKCVRFFCPKQCCSYQGLDTELSDVSKSLEELWKDGEILDKEQQDMLSAKEMENKPVISLQSVIDQIGNYVTKPSVRVIGVCDPRGSGNLSRQIDRKLARNFLVISVNVRNHEMVQVQEDIIRKLQLSDDSRETESQDERSLLIRNYIGSKKFVLLLDGLSENWEPSDLSRIGVPLEDDHESKIIITSPTKSVIEQMKVDVCVEAGVLTEDVLSQRLPKDFPEPQPLDLATLAGSTGIVAFPLQRPLAEPIPVDMARLATLADGPITMWTTSVNWILPRSPGLTQNHSKKNRSLVEFVDTQNRLKHSPFYAS